jgi:hypothetical protein
LRSASFFCFHVSKPPLLPCVRRVCDLFRYGLATHPTLPYYATAAEDNTIRLWSAEPHQCLAGKVRLGHDRLSIQQIQMQSQQLSIICVVCAGGCNLALTAAGVVVRRGAVSSAVCPVIATRRCAPPRTTSTSLQTVRDTTAVLLSVMTATGMSCPVRNRCASNDALSSKTEVKRFVRLSFVVCCRQLDCGRAEDGGRAGASLEAHRARYYHREARTVRNPPSFFSTFPTMFVPSLPWQNDGIYIHICIAQKRRFCEDGVPCLSLRSSRACHDNQDLWFYGTSNEANGRCSSHCSSLGVRR